jgi:hypothetical protein
MATARGHLDRIRMSKPHTDSQSVSALRRHHDAQIISDLKRSRLQTPEPFDVNKATRSATLHMDYTGQLPTPCTSGVQYFQIACWGHYIDIQPLTSLRAAQTTKALTTSVNFFRKHGIILDTLRMDNQQSCDLRETARILKLHNSPRSEKVEPSWKSHSNSQKSHHRNTRWLPSRLLTRLLGQMFTTDSVNIKPYPSVRIQRFYLSISWRPRQKIQF